MRNSVAKLLFIVMTIATSLVLISSCSYKAPLEISKGKLTIVNDSGGTLRISVDGDYVGSVSDGNQRSWTVGRGKHIITWERPDGTGTGGEIYDFSTSKTIRLS